MAKPINAMYGGYGAFELKSQYRRNMLTGTLMSAGLVVIIVLGIWVYKVLTAVETVYIQPIVIRTIADLGPPPTVSKPKPQVDIAKPDIAKPKVGIPKPVADDDVIDDDVMIASRDDLAEIVAPPMDETMMNAGADIIVDIEDYMPGADEFIPVEIPAEMIYEHTPEYPRLAKTAGMEAVVWVKALVDKNGNVRDAMILKSSGSKAGFDEAAVKAAFKCRFKPAIQNGRPVAVWVSYQVEFVQIDG